MKLVAAAIVVLGITGLVYEWLGERRDRQRFAQIGRSVDIGGRTLNLYCSGIGSPAVVLDSGGGMPGYSWLLVQPGVARLTRACWYDRAGYGWSDPAPSSYGSDAIARDLHELLHRGGVAPPYVLVGHSFGAFNIRMYYELFPRDVAGIVLVDPSHEDLAKIPNPAGIGRPLVSLPDRLYPAAAFVARIFSRLGVLRLVASSGVPPRGITADQWATLSALRRRFNPQEGSARANVTLMRETGKLGSVPLIVLTAGKQPGGVDPVEVTKFERARIELLEQLAHKSTRGRQIIVPGSGHMVPWEAPQAVVGAVRDVLGEAQHTRSER
jgi:pimeloyl-ACP methyl ester carboxylesterase